MFTTDKAKRRNAVTRQSDTTPRGVARVLVHLRSALIVFHLLLLCERLTDGSIFQPLILAKWIAGALLVGSTFALQRFVPTVMKTRRAGAVFWLLVLVLHVAFPSDIPADSLSLEASVQAGAALLLGFIAVTGAAAIVRWAGAPSRQLHPLRVPRSPSRRVLSLRAPPFHSFR